MSTMIRHQFVCILSLFTFFSFSQAQQHYQLDCRKDASFLGLGVASAILGLVATQRTSPVTNDEIIRLNREDVFPVDRFATHYWSTRSRVASDVLLGASMLLPASLALSSDIRDDITTMTIMYAEVVSFTFGVAQLTQGISERVRPFVYNSNPEIPLTEKKKQDARHAFFSGHTSMAFGSAVFTATVFDAYFPDSKWKYPMWGVSLAGATVTGLLRVHSGKHFPTDVVIGAVFGALTGYFIPRWHQCQKTQSLHAAPTFHDNQWHIAIHVSF